MRVSLVSLVVAALAGCSGSLQTDTLGTGSGDNGGSGAGAGNLPAECNVAADCTPAGPKCCDCPTHAVPITDLAQRACAEVGCAPMSCGSPMQAACEAGRCVLECSPVACDPSLVCENGFATDANGCLTCTCAVPPAPAACRVDGDCAETRQDCCGCALGGKDTALPVDQVASYDASLGCSATPVCPGYDVCPPDLAARCVQGECALVSGVLPTNACGRADLAACASGCTLNASDQATMYGVGVCQP